MYKYLHYKTTKEIEVHHARIIPKGKVLYCYHETNNEIYLRDENTQRLVLILAINDVKDNLERVVVDNEIIVITNALNILQDIHDSYFTLFLLQQRLQQDPSTAVDILVDLAKYDDRMRTIAKKYDMTIEGI